MKGVPKVSENPVHDASPIRRKRSSGPCYYRSCSWVQVTVINTRDADAGSDHQQSATVSETLLDCD